MVWAPSRAKSRVAQGLRQLDIQHLTEIFLKRFEFAAAKIFTEKISTNRFFLC
jgi:hypothetical protein